MTGKWARLIQVTFDAKGLPVVSKERSHPRAPARQRWRWHVRDAAGDQRSGRELSGHLVRRLHAIRQLHQSRRWRSLPVPPTRHRRRRSCRFAGNPCAVHGPHRRARPPTTSVERRTGRSPVLLGNHTFVPAGRISADSPLRGYKESQLLNRYMDARGHAAGRMAPGGALFRIEDDGDSYSLQFGGFRNPYNHAYNFDGETFTFDSDMEWDINLPWYREVRSVHGVPSADYGWAHGVW